MSVTLDPVLRERLATDGAAGVCLRLRVVLAVRAERRRSENRDQFSVQPLRGAGR